MEIVGMSTADNTPVWRPGQSMSDVSDTEVAVVVVLVIDVLVEEGALLVSSKNSLELAVNGGEANSSWTC